MPRSMSRVLFQVKKKGMKFFFALWRFSGVFPLPNVKLTWGKFDLFADKMTAEVNPHSECYEVHNEIKVVMSGSTLESSLSRD